MNPNHTTASARALRQMLRLDGIAAVAGGVIHLGGAVVLSPLFGLPVALLLFMGAVNAIYAWRSFAKVRAPQVSAADVREVALANFGWVVVCVAIVGYFTGHATTLGIAYVSAEGLLVGLLAVIEYRLARRARNAP